MKYTTLPSFENEADRRAWITDNADYFTCIRRHSRRYEREEFKTLEEARKGAKRLIDMQKLPVMIYAVFGPYDTWVENIMPKS